MVEVRPATEADIPAFARLLGDMERDYGTVVPVETIEHDLRHAPAGVEFLLAVVPGGGIAGFASHSELWPSAGAGLGRLLFLKELYVAPRWRRRGIAKRLMGGVALLAQERGCPRVGWNAPRDSAAAQALYDGLGARRAEWLLSYRLAGEALTKLAASGS